MTACDDKEACTEGPLWTFTTAAANETPVANAGNDQTVEVGPGCTTNVTLNGSGSLDPDGDSLAYAWTYNGGSAEGVDPTIELPLGTHTITLVVNDGIFDSEPDTLIITVQDTTGPAVQVTAPSPGQALQDGVTFSADASGNKIGTMAY